MPSAETHGVEIPNLRFSPGSKASHSCTTKGKSHQFPSIFFSASAWSRGDGGVFSSNGSLKQFLLCFESSPFPYDCGFHNYVW